MTRPEEVVMTRYCVAVLLLVACIAGAAGSARGQAGAPPPPGRPPLMGADTRFPAVTGKGICNVGSGWCPIANAEQYAPGAPCYCITAPNQSVSGQVEQRNYLGNVNPYFNPYTSVPSTIR